MSVTIIATPGDPEANSFLTEEEATAYFAARVPLATPWPPADPTAALVMATRVLSTYAQPSKSLEPGGPPYYYKVRPTWTGAISTTTQRLPWPRTGMFNTLGLPIPVDEIPDELKAATAELAGQLVMSDTTLDNAATAAGLKSVTAGSVSVSFQDMIIAKVLPDAVVNLLPASWFTSPSIEPVYSSMYPALFDVVSE